MTVAGFRNGDAAPLALGQALCDGLLSCPNDGRVLFLRAQVETCNLAPNNLHWTCVQGFRPFAQRLVAMGLPVQRDEALINEPRFGLVLLLPPRQRDEARAWFAQAVAHVRPGSVIVASMANANGARSGARDLQQLLGPVQQHARYKSRVFWATVTDACVNHALKSQWSLFDAVQPILDGRFVSRPGLFAWDRIDPASALLAKCLPDSLCGAIADLGAGYGYLSTEALRRCPGITALDLYEAEARALEPARRNLQRIGEASGHAASVQVHWHDVTQGLPHRYDGIISNPPFHQGRTDCPQLGQAFIRTAAMALKPGGRLWMVANRHLPYEATLAQCFASVTTVLERDGFKVITALRGAMQTAS